MRNAVNFTVVVGDVNGHILGEFDVRQIRPISIDMNVLLNGLSISAKGELQSLGCIMGKTVSLFGC